MLTQEAGWARLFPAHKGGRTQAARLSGKEARQHSERAAATASSGKMNVSPTPVLFPFNFFFAGEDVDHFQKSSLNLLQHCFRSAPWALTSSHPAPPTGGVAHWSAKTSPRLMCSRLLPILHHRKTLLTRLSFSSRPELTQTGFLNETVSTEESLF